MLTKADKKEGTLWLQRLMSEPQKSVNGYFATRLSDTEERGISWDQARDIERELFEKEPWREVPDRLGVKNLAKYLSGKLYSMIQRTYSPSVCRG